MHLSRAKSISARADRALNRIGGARDSQVLTLSGEKMGFEGALEGFERRGEPGKERQRIPDLRSSGSECSRANASLEYLNISFDDIISMVFSSFDRWIDDGEVR